MGSLQTYDLEFNKLINQQPLLLNTIVCHHKKWGDCWDQND